MGATVLYSTPWWGWFDGMLSNVDRPPKKTLRRQDIAGTARFLTFSCYRRLPLFANDRIKDRFVEHLATAVSRHDIKLLAWVVMPEHVHLIVLPSGAAAVGGFLNALKNAFAREILSRWRVLNAGILPKLRGIDGAVHFWQAGGGYDRNVVATELVEKIRYVHANPARRGLSPDASSWRWSSAAAYDGLADAFALKIAFDLVPDSKGPLV